MQENEDVAGPSVDCNFIDVDHDSEPEYGVLQLESAVMINSVETLKSSGGQPRSLSIQLRSGFSFFYSTVDTGSPVSFLNKRTCDFLLQRSPSIEFRDTLSIPCMLTITRSPFASWGRFKFRFFSSGWRVANAQFLISENRTRNLLGLDLQEKLGIVTTQLKAKTIQSVDYSSSDPISEYWRSFFAKKYAHVFSRLGRSKSPKEYTNFKFPLVARQIKGRKVPIRIQDRVASEIKFLVEQGRIEKLDKCTTDFFIAPIVLTAKKDGSIKLALNAKPMNAQIWKNKYQMPNIHVPDGGKLVLKELATRHSDLAHSLKSGLNSNTLRFSAIASPPGTQVISRRAPVVQPTRLSRTSKLENLLLSDPGRVKVFRKIIDRQSGKPMYKLTKFKIVRVTDHTYITDNGKVYRKNHICLKPNFRSTVLVAPNTIADRV